MGLRDTWHYRRSSDRREGWYNRCESIIAHARKINRDFLRMEFGKNGEEMRGEQFTNENNQRSDFIYVSEFVKNPVKRFCLSCQGWRTSFSNYQPHFLHGRFQRTPSDIFGMQVAACMYCQQTRMTRTKTVTRAKKQKYVGAGASSRSQRGANENSPSS